MSLYDPMEQLRLQMYQHRSVSEAAVERRIRSIVCDELEKHKWTNTQSTTQNDSTQQSSQQQQSGFTGSSALLVPLVLERLQSLRRRVDFFERDVGMLCSRLPRGGQLDEYQKRLVIEHSQFISSLSMAVQSLIDILVNQSSTQDQHDGEDETETATR
jgi:hypothetical protein